MEPAEIEWLCSVFQETPYDGDSPQPKRMKFSDVPSELQQHFPGKEYSVYETSRYIHQAFPTCETKRSGKERHTYLTGLERKCHPRPVVADPTSSLQAAIEQLKHRVAELEAKENLREVVCRQAAEIARHSSVVTQGPVSVEALTSLDMRSIVSELATRAPDLYQLCMTIGDTQRSHSEEDSGGGTTTEEIKVVSAICSLLNARSARTKGLQLLLGMMLVARGTSRQVQC